MNGDFAISEPEHPNHFARSFDCLVMPQYLLATPSCPPALNTSMMNGMLLANPFRWADPHTWPWTIYVWLAFLADGQLRPLWRWIHRNRAESWPIASGQIESLTVSESKRSFVLSTPRGNSPKIVVERGYSYSVAGNVETGTYKRDFSTEEALEFQRDLKGKPVAVHYNPNKPSKSTLSEPSSRHCCRRDHRKPLPSTPYRLQKESTS